MKHAKASTSFRPPENWMQMLEKIRLVRQKYPAPVDTMGCDQVGTSGAKDEIKRFEILVSLMLSSQTKDPITWAAVQKLKENNMCHVDGILGAQEKDIENLIYPAGFYRRKAIYLKKVAAILQEQYNSDIPNTIEGLCKLPGVGSKMAHLCMQEAWGINSGIGVDTHVHRISARLGWVPAKNVKTPEQTRLALESWLPREYWREINHLLVGFGQTICTPTRPKCNECANNDLCPSSTTKAGKKSGDTLVEEAKKEKGVTVKVESTEVPAAAAPTTTNKKVAKRPIKIEPGVKQELEPSARRRRPRLDNS
uniref:Endonuclease III homolog n=1 Tax=Aceria tosichella TaxID=561515 RepID=A0A6G1SQ18_9ACAR